MKNSLKTLGLLCAAIIFLVIPVILGLILFCIHWIYESMYQTFFPKKWKKRQEKDAEKNWKKTTSNLLKANKENILLEFTATQDLEDKNIYDLSEHQYRR